MPDSARRKHLTPGRIVAGAAALVVLVTCAIAIGWGKGELETYQRHQTEERQQAADYHAKEAQDIHERVCVSVPTSRNRRAEACSEEPPETDGEAKYTEADLRAQQDMAVWAYGVLLASVGTFVLTAIGVALLWLTLDATQKTLRESESATTASNAAAEASKRANAIAAQSLKLQQQAYALQGRPFVFVEVDVPNFWEWERGEELFSWGFRLTNHGEHPAVLKRVSAGVALLYGPPYERSDQLDEDQGIAIIPLRMEQETLHAAPTLAKGQPRSLARGDPSLLKDSTEEDVTRRRVRRVRRDLQEFVPPILRWYLVVQVDYESPNGLSFHVGQSACLVLKGVTPTVELMGATQTAQVP